MIKLDQSRETIVILCTQCTYRGIDTDLARARQRGTAHAVSAHDAPFTLLAQLEASLAQRRPDRDA
jgi:hypothetical protein